MWQFTTERTCANKCLFYTQHYLLSYAPCQKICVLHWMLFTTERNLDLLICLKEFLPSKNFCLIFLTLSTIVSSLLYTVVYSMFYIMQRSVGNECLTLDELNRGDFNVYYLLYRGLLGTSAWHFMNWIEAISMFSKMVSSRVIKISARVGMGVKSCFGKEDVCMCVCMYARTYVRTYPCMYAWMNVSVRVYVCIHACMHACMCMYVHVCMYVCM